MSSISLFLPKTLHMSCTPMTEPIYWINERDRTSIFCWLANKATLLKVTSIWKKKDSRKNVLISLVVEMVAYFPIGAMIGNRSWIKEAKISNTDSRCRPSPIEELIQKSFDFTLPELRITHSCQVVAVRQMTEFRMLIVKVSRAPLIKILAHHSLLSPYIWMRLSQT